MCRRAFLAGFKSVSANATYQYVRKGQPLFTIYSPDVVSSEQEYLLARQNQKAFVQDMHGMAAQEGGWLLQAAEERLRQFGVPQQAIADLEQTGKVQRNMPSNRRPPATSPNATRCLTPTCSRKRSSTPSPISPRSGSTPMFFRMLSARLKAGRSGRR